ncbi:MAG TPA: NADH-quinone oxidoreductase subunit N [Opitutaceae bacterium]|nr:NADH-quinone oxidoreductase subunit N [Opitutaceae bacterium]
MNLDLLQAAAADNRWVAILPELLLGCLALLLLVLEIVLPKKQHGIIPTFSIVGQLGILVGTLVNFRTEFIGQETFNGLLYHSMSGQFLRVFFLLTSILVSILGVVSLAKQKMPRVEFFNIVLVVSAAMMLLVQSHHFVMLFVALETVTIGFYILVSYYRTNPLSLEAGLKYLVMGALSSAILLFGIVFLYGVVGNPALAASGVARGSMDFTSIREFLAAHPDHFLAKVGILFVLAGVAFKIGTVPFQIWVPDVYQGAPTPVTAFLAVGSKAAGFGVLMVLAYTFGAYQGLVVPVLSVMAAATILFGNIAALTQYNVKRLIGLSGVSHAGYLLLGVIASYSDPLAPSAVYFYLFTYLIASFAVFAVMTHVSGDDDTDQELENYADLVKTHPFLATILAIGLGSLAGIPPLAGFIGKLMIFLAAYHAGLWALLGIAIVGVVISIYYYFGWIKAAFFPSWRLPVPATEPTPVLPRTPVGVMAGVAMVTLAVASVVLGFYQGPLVEWLALR